MHPGPQPPPASGAPALQVGIAVAVAWSLLLGALLLLNHYDSGRKTGAMTLALICLWGLGLLSVAAGVRTIERRRRERHELEDGRRQSDERYRRIVDTAAEGIWAIDEQFVTIFVNRHMADMLGYEPEAMRRLPVPAFMFPEDVTSHDQEMARRQRGQSSRYERRFRHRDGSTVWTTVSATPMQGPDGRFVGSFAMFTDVTERRRAEQAMLEGEARYRALVDLSPDAIFVHQDGRVVFANRAGARLLGAPDEAAVVGRDILDLVHPESRDAITHRTREALSQDGPVPPAELRLLRLDGSTVDVEEAASAISYNGRPAVQTVVRDHTGQRRAAVDRRRSEEQLRQAQKMEAVGRLAGGVAHDFNNHLQAILASCDIALADTPPDDPRRPDLEDVRHAAHDAAQLARQLLAFGRRQDARFEALDVNAVLARLLRILQQLLGEGITVELQAGTCPLWTRADATMVEQVVMNLCLNARDAMPSGGRLLIGTESQTVTDDDARRHPDARPGQFTAIRVADTGQGMDPSTLARIFEPFFTTKEKGKGTGLGLTTVYAVAQQHHGWVEVTSAPGCGSTFTVFLPAAPPPDKTDEPQPAASPGSPT